MTNIATPVPMQPLAAAGLMLAAMVIIGAIDNVIALIARDLGLWQFLVMRAAISVPLIAGAGLVVGARLLPLSWRAVALRSFWVTLAMLVYFGALAVMPIAQALAGLFTSPVFVVVISVFLLGERIGPRRVSAVLVGFAGVLVVLGPSGGAAGGFGLFAAFAGLFYALGALATRRACAAESTFALLLGVMLCQALVACVALAVLGVVAPDVPPGTQGFLLRGWSGDLGAALPLVILQAVGSALGVGLIIRAYQLGETASVAVYEYSVFIFGPFFGWWLFGQNVTLLQGAGIALISLAGIIIARRGA